MKFKSIYIKEQEHYLQSWLVNHLKYGDKQSDVDNALKVIRKLKEYGVLKAVKSDKINLSDIQDEDNENVELCEVKAGDDECKYKFDFVGVIVVNGRVLKCYPKYLAECDDGENGLKDEMRQIMRVLERYGKSREQVLYMLNDVTDTPGNGTNVLDLFLFLLRDYYENGLYSNVVDSIENNGRGEILWGKTVNETVPFFSKGRPYYLDVYTRRRIDDDYDYFRRLHRHILIDVSRQLGETDLLDLFGLDGVDFLDEAKEDFNDNDYILYRLDGELNRQFNSRKQLLLKAMRLYIKRDMKLSEEDCISSFGTTSFNLVWEKALSEIFDNSLNKRLDDLVDNLSDKFKDRHSERLIDLIEKPYWTMAGKDAKETLEPDIVYIPDDISSNGKKQFLILDAKYYTPILEKGKAPDNQPGIGDVTKQYLYQLAFRDFIGAHDFDVKNYFLLPSKGDKAEDCGEVHLKFLANCGLEDIKVWFLPAKTVFDCYLDGREFPIGELKLDVEKAEERQMA